MQTVSQQVDALLDQTSYLLYGTPYSVLDAKRQSTVIAEACWGFTDEQLEAGDNLRKEGRE